MLLLQFLGYSWLTFLFYCLYVFFTSERKRLGGDRNEKSPVVLPPCPPYLPIVGHAYRLLYDAVFPPSGPVTNMNIIEKLDQLTQGYGKTAMFLGMGHRAIVFTIDPAVIQHVFSGNPSYHKGPKFYHQYRDLFGDGIFNADGEKWKTLRKFASSFFHTSALKTYAESFRCHASTLRDRLRASNGEADVQKLMLTYTLEAFCEIGFGVNLSEALTEEERESFQLSFDKIQTHVALRGKWNTWWPLKETLIPPTDFRRQLAIFNDVVYDLIDRRSREPKESLAEKRDLFSRLLLSTPTPSRVELRDFLVNFLIAGRDTTALLLSWSLHMLAKHPRVEERVREEIDRVANGGDLSWEQAKEMKYTHAMLSETLRLYPPVPLDGYGIKKDDILPGNLLAPRGDGNNAVIYSAFLLHRRPELWGDDCLEFKPERFLQSSPAPYTYAPFHLGPRICLGQSMAYFEAKIALVELLPHFKFTLKPDFQVIPKRGIILTAVNGNVMKVKEVSQ